MRSIAIIALALVTTATAASAQGTRLGRRNGNQDQQQPGFEKPTTKEEKRFPLGSAWVAVSLNGKPLGGTERLAFQLDDQFRARGFGGCNSFSATAFPLKQQGIAVGPLAMTKRSCDASVMATERAYLTALRTAAKWETQIGTLIMTGPSGEIRFERSL